MIIDINKSYLTINLNKIDELNNECDINEEEKEQIREAIEPHIKFATLMCGNSILYEPSMLLFIKNLLVPTTSKKRRKRNKKSKTIIKSVV